MFDVFSGFTQLTIHPETIPLTAFCTPNGLYEWSRMPQGVTGAPAWFVSVMRLVTGNLDTTQMYLDDAIGSNDSPTTHVATLATFFSRLRLHNLKLSSNKTRIGAARVEFLGHIISQDGVRPNDDKIAALTRMPMPRDIKQLRSLLGGLSYYRNFLSNMAKRVRPITALLKKGATFGFTSPLERPFAPYSQNSQPHQYLSSPIETQLSTSPDHSVCIATPVPMVSEQHSNGNSLTALSVP